MQSLPKAAHKLLKRIYLQEYFEITTKDLHDFFLLSKEGYIKSIASLPVQNLPDKMPWYDFFVITSKGEVYLSSLRNDKVRYYIPIVISILSLLISIIALLKP